MDEEKRQRLHGTVERVVFRNDSNQWTVLELSADAELYKVVGELPPLGVGETVTLEGSWVEHAVFGPQFRAQSCEQSLPADADSILRYLASGAIKGVGPATAARLVEKFGDQTLEIMEKEPQRLAEVRGVTRAKAMQIAEEYARQFGLREVMLAFVSYGLSPQAATRCWKKWGPSTLERIRQNPYVLCTTGLYIGFAEADRVAQQMALSGDDARRLEAGIQFVLRHNLQNGHTCLPADKLIPTAANMLGLTAQAIEDVLQTLVDGLVLRQELFGGRSFIFLPALYRAETYTAGRLQTMCAFPPTVYAGWQERLTSIEREQGIVYAAQQRQAIEAALCKGVLVLTGGPGTGKTTTLLAILSLLESRGDAVVLTAPTGRAAKRMTELTGHDAKTLHRLLEVQWDDEENATFARNEKHPLDADAVIVDELSMVDSLLFENLLRAVKIGCRLILVGDTDQLPAVGAGCVLHDLIASQRLPVVQLTEVFRQALQSDIVSNAHRIVSGAMPTLNHREGDFFFLPRTTYADVSQTVLDLCHHRLPDTYGYSMFDGIQVLCPGRKGELGTMEVNRRLQALLNPPADDRREVTVEGVVLRVGDKVMQVRNNYDIAWTRDRGEGGQGVFNGDIGILEAVDPPQGILQVRFDDRVALYTKQEAEDLELAYAITVHKSQGCEFEAVVLPLFRQTPLLCYRNLLYTAVTRAKRLLVIVGDSETVAAMVNNDRKTLRYSGLRHFLRREASAMETASV